MLYKSHRALVFITTMYTTVAKKKKKNCQKYRPLEGVPKPGAITFFFGAVSMLIGLALGFV